MASFRVGGAEDRAMPELALVPGLGPGPYEL